LVGRTTRTIALTFSTTSWGGTWAEQLVLRLTVTLGAGKLSKVAIRNLGSESMRLKIGCLCAVGAGVLAIAATLVLGYRFYLVHRHEPTRPKVGSPFDEGGKVIQAIEAYKTAKGSYPGSLDDLTPEFISQIPLPHWGVDRWDYATYRSPDGTLHYALSVRLRDNDYVCHIYSEGSWWYDD